MALSEKEICAYLENNVEPGRWQIMRPVHGFSSGKRFLGRSANRQVFVSLDIHPDLIQHLSAASITPRFVAGGSLARTWITVQEYIAAPHPDQAWFLANTHTLASLLKTLQVRSELRTSLPPVKEECRSLLTHYVQRARDLYQQQRARNLAEEQRIAALLEQYEQRLQFIEGQTPLAPVHGDLNPTNLLVTPAATYLVDWEALHLSDPLYDIAIVLWWLYPRSQWGQFLDLFQIDLDKNQQRERFHLYVSTSALEASLFFRQRGHTYLAERFLTDALRAFRQELPQEPRVHFTPVPLNQEAGPQAPYLSSRSTSR